MSITSVYETPSRPTEDEISIHSSQTIPLKRPPNHKTNVTDVSQLQLKLPVAAAPKLTHRGCSVILGLVSVD
jgi:hypothetical protein